MTDKSLTLLISKILTDTKEKSIKELCKELYSIGILTKEYIEDNILLIYTKYNSTITNIQKECKSIIIDNTTRNIISYSCDTPVLNNECDKYFENLDDCIDDEISTSYEGPYISLFYNNNKWYFSTRRMVKINNDNYKYYDDFNEIIIKLGFENIDLFYDTLNKSNSYHFILISYNNQVIIDYTKIFGDKYMLLYLISIKDNKQCELPLTSYNTENLSTKYFIVLELTDYNEYIYNNDNIYENIIYEGIIVKRYDKINNYYKIFKLQTYSYQYAKYKKINTITGLMYLYQYNKLYDYLYTHCNYKMIMINYQYRNTIFIFDNTFKALTLEFIALYNKLWNGDTNNIKNTNIYTKLSKEYKKILYNIRGIYIKNKYIAFKDVLNILKSINTEYIISILKYRNLSNINRTIVIDNVYYASYMESCNLLENYYINN